MHTVLNTDTNGHYLTLEFKTTHEFSDTGSSLSNSNYRHKKECIKEIMNDLQNQNKIVYLRQSRNLEKSQDLGKDSRRRQWHPAPVLLPGKSHARRSLVGCSPWGHKESDMTERLHFHFSLSYIGEGNGNPLQCSCLENPRDGGA